VTTRYLPGKIKVLFNCRRAIELLCEFLAWRKYKRSDLLKVAAAANLFT